MWHNNKNNKQDSSSPLTASTKTKPNNAQLSFRLGLTANMMFFIGAANFVAFSALELNNQARSAAAHATYVISFSFFFLSGALELTIDSVMTKRRRVRAYRHARYTKKGWLNIVISAVFVIGSILDLVAFALWQKRDFTIEHRVLFASAHTWLLSAILSLCGQYAEIDVRDTSELVDGVGNVLFFVGAMIDCIVRYMDNDELPFAEESVSQLEFSASPMWLANAVCFVVADLLRLKQLSKRGSNNILEDCDANDSFDQVS